MLMDFILSNFQSVEFHPPQPLLQRCHLPCTEDERQLVREPFLLSYRNDTFLVFFLGFVDNLHCLPKCDMPLTVRSEDPVQKA